MTHPGPATGHWLHTRSKWLVSLLETANLPAAILPPQPEQGLLNHLQAAVLPRAASDFYTTLGSPSEISLGCNVSPSSPSVQLHVHSEGSQRKPRDLREALSLGKQPLSRGLPPSEAIPTGMGLDHHGLVASTWTLKSRTQRGTCPNRCSGRK